ncbi:cupin domain-containing protein [Erythrobacter sp. NE805]|uniref:cupin domain-containing protein n=1 Tax=Erythrobacter sp. NE805 TaxID=3389875 RepID=UPI00396AFA4A
MTSALPSIASRIVRYADLVPCRDAFIDTRSPGSDRKENFTIIGPGVAENPNQHVHISEPHGFNIGGARQPPRCLNSQHSHETVEVFYVHSGRWRFMTGERGTDGEVFMGPGDLISIPTRLFRGFENVGTEEGFLWAVLGGDDAGHVLWAPYVFDMARDYGLVLLEDGMLIDTAKGEAVPAGARPMPETTPAQVAALTRADSAALAKCVIPADTPCPAALHPATPGVTERWLIGPAPIDWAHGFTLAEVTLAEGAALARHRLEVPDVWFVAEGAVEVAIGDETALCGPGDTITVPVGMTRGLANRGSGAAKVVQVRGGDALPALLPA